MSAAIDALNASVSAHWTAIEAYTAMTHRLGVGLGLSALADHFKAEADDERTHLARLVARLEFLGADRTFAHDAPAVPGDVPGMLDAAGTLENRAATIERAGIRACRDEADEGSAAVLAENLEGSEESILWLAQQRRQIGLMGLDNWLADQR